MFIRSDEGLAFQTSALFSLYDENLTLIVDTVKPRLSELAGTGQNGPDYRESRYSKTWILMSQEKKRMEEEVKFPRATEQIWANQSSLKCSVLVIARNARRFMLWSETNSVRTRGSSLNFEGKRFCHGHKIWLINIFMKNWCHRSKSREIRIIEVWMIDCGEF